MNGKFGRGFAAARYNTDAEYGNESSSFPQFPGGSESYVSIKRSKQSNLKILRRSRRLTLEALSELTGISPSYLSRLEGGARRLNTDLLERLSSVLGCQPGDLLNQGPPASGGTFGSAPRAGARVSGMEGGLRSENLGEMILPQKDLPVYTLSTALGILPSGDAQASMVDFTTPADWSIRPPQLLGVSKAFGLYVGDDGYAPKYMSGDTLFVHPARPLLPRSSVMVLTKDDRALVRQFHGWGQNTIFLSLFTEIQSAQDVQSMEKEDIKAVYKIIGTIEAY